MTLKRAPPSHARWRLARRVIAITRYSGYQKTAFALDGIVHDIYLMSQNMLLCSRWTFWFRIRNTSKKSALEVSRVKRASPSTIVVPLCPDTRHPLLSDFDLAFLAFLASRHIRVRWRNPRLFCLEVMAFEISCLSRRVSMRFLVQEYYTRVQPID
ncbi:hypothetical protein CVT25_013175 [Psilocybe cyanescens]|uniref:Uncharacterized protein n=1 Tax=Psilocybe cyanescens TaxID=93625 RepID=A0A409XCM1_PSICY|nr:hypothetical protein CVT25_013175 [Psilocybe cyanescens]